MNVNTLRFRRYLSNKLSVAHNTIFFQSSLSRQKNCESLPGPSLTLVPEPLSRQRIKLTGRLFHHASTRFSRHAYWANTFGGRLALKSNAIL